MSCHRYSLSREVPSRRAFTVLELLVCITVIGVLMGLILPAVQAARETARRMDCLQNLRQIGIALHNCHDTQGRIPAGWSSVSGTSSAIGWAARILPYLEQNQLRQLVDERAGIDSPNNAAARTATLETYMCASDVEDDHFQLFKEIGDHESHEPNSTEVIVELPAASYLGVFGSSDPDAELSVQGEGAFVRDRDLTFSRVLRGTSHVLFVGERTARKLPATWLGIDLEGEDAAGRVAGQALLGPNRDDADECEFDSRHPGGVNFLWGDGHGTWLVDEVDPLLYRTLACLQE